MKGRAPFIWGAFFISANLNWQFSGLIGPDNDGARVEFGRRSREAKTSE
jgi:hypothetical protein